MLFFIAMLQGEKLFYLIKPTQANLMLYERWLSSSKQNEMFFGDQVTTNISCSFLTTQLSYLFLSLHDVYYKLLHLFLVI